MLSILPAALAVLASLAHFVTQFHPAAPFGPQGLLIVLALYAPMIVIILLCLLPERFLASSLRWVIVLAAVWIGITFLGLFMTIMAETRIDLFWGAFMSSIGLVATLLLVGKQQRPALRRLVRRGLALLAAVYAVAAFALPAVIEQRAAAFGPDACLFAFNPETWGADEIVWPDTLTLFQRFIAHRGRNYYTGAFRLELLDGDQLYHWSLRNMDFVPTENRYLSSLGLEQGCGVQSD